MLLITGQWVREWAVRSAVACDQVVVNVVHVNMYSSFELISVSPGPTVFSLPYLFFYGLSTLNAKRYEGNQHH